VCERLHAASPKLGLDGMTQLHGRRRDGASFPVDAMASPVRERSLTILTVRDMTENWEQEAALRRALDDKNTLLKELYHRVKNNLQLIISMFNLQVRALGDSPACQPLLEAAGRVRAMALVHERLYQSGTLSVIVLDVYVAELCDRLAGAASAQQRGIAVRVEAEPAQAGLDVAVPLGLLLNELVSNSLKHAFPEGRHGTIQVRLAHVRPNAMQLTVTDDGIGLPPRFDRTSAQTLGLKLVSALSDQLRASFTLENHALDGRSGVLATLVFSLPGAAAGPPRQGESTVSVEVKP
jgi:two-component sensor histidine kinase